MEENRTITISQYYGSLPNMKSKFDRFARKDFFKGKTREEWEKWALASRKTLADLLGLDKMDHVPLMPRLVAMKKIAAPIRVELAQYRELASFAQFGSELDADTKEKLEQGVRIKEVLKQPQYKPMPVQYQVIILYVATKKYLLDVPVENITRFESEFFEFLDTQYPQVPQAIKEEQVISDETEKTLVTAIEEFKKRFH